MSTAQETNIVVFTLSDGLFDIFHNNLSNNHVRVSRHLESNTNYLIILPDALDKLDETKLSKDLKIVIVNFLSTLSPPQSQTQPANQVYEKLKLVHPNTRLLHIFDLYSLDPQNAYKSPLDLFLGNCLAENSFSSTPTGDRQYYPTHVQDALSGIIRSLFIQGTQGKEFILASETFSDLELGYLLQKNQESKGEHLNLKLDGNGGYDFQSFYLKVAESQAHLSWLPTSNLQDILSKYIIPVTTRPKQELELTNLSPKITIVEDKPAKTSKLKPLHTFKFHKPKGSKTVDLHLFEKQQVGSVVKNLLLLFTLSVTLPLVTSLVSLIVDITQISSSFKYISKGDVVRSEQALKVARVSQWVTEQTIHYYVAAISLISPKSAEKFNNSLLIIDHTHKLLASSHEVYKIGNSLYQTAINKSNQNISELIIVLKLNLSQIGDQLAQLQLLLDSSESKLLGFSLLDSSTLDLIKQVRAQITQLSPSLDLYLELSKDTNTKRLLILSQDPNELRSTGGYLNSVSLVTLKEGKVLDIQTESSLNIDKLIEGRVEPPKIISSLLGEDRWLFRDSNTQADFAESAKQIRWFYNRFKGVSLDGIIGTNTFLISSYLRNGGALKNSDGKYLGAEQLLVDSANPTQDGKQDFLTTTNQLIFKQFISGESNLIPLFRAISSSISLGELNLWFADDQLQTVVRSSLLSGEINTPPCHPQISLGGCLSSFIYLNESNYSLAKINLYQQKTESMQVKIQDDGQIDHVYELKYHYPVAAPITTTKSYKGYYQLYLSNNLHNFDLVIDDQQVDPELIVQTTVDGANKYEFSTNFLINQDHTIKLNYTLNSKLDFKKPLLSYTFDWLKQPGTQNQQRFLNVHYPANLQSKAMTLQFTSPEAGVLEYSSQLAQPVSAGLLFKNTSL